MKKISKIISFILVAVFATSLFYTVSYASEVQYTENIIPKMTGTTTPSGKVSASSFESGAFYPYYAFDKDPENSWASIGTQGWLQYEFGESKCITKYTITPRHVLVNESPKDWTFEAFDDSLNEWVILDTQKSITSWQLLTKKEFTFNNEKTYLKYRINVTATCGGAAIVIGELEMMETTSVSTTSTLKVVLEPKEELQLSIDDDLSENAKLTWESSDNEVATVDSNGVITALKPGNTIITTRSEDGQYIETVNILVVESAKEYRLAVDLRVGKSCRVTVDDYKNTEKVTWTSLDPTVATISSKGKVTTVGVGLAIMTATDETGKEIGQIYVRVRG